ncbi:MAG: hypothetical protein ABIC57_03125 [bacterium]
MIVKVELKVKGLIESTPSETVSMIVSDTRIPGIMIVIPYIAAKFNIVPTMMLERILSGIVKNLMVWLTSVFASPKITIIIIQ